MARNFMRVWMIAALALGAALGPAGAQTQQRLQVQVPSPGGQPPPAPANTTVVPRSPVIPKGGAPGQLSLAAFLTEDSQPIQQGLVWRVFREKATVDGKSVLVSTHRDANPTVRLEAGTYQIHVALGRANLTRKIVVAPEQATLERFVLNAGGLRVVPVLAKGEPASDRVVSFEVQSDERDSHGQRVKVVTGAKTGVVLRLNAGIYSIVSTYGDANAVARADVTVEAGKLTDVTLAHAVAKVTFKLVTRPGGDAIADTHWSLTTGQGDAVRESSGALPTHFLAPGAYVVSARHAGRVYRRQFSVRTGDTAFVEVVIP
jgi:hypothetical protein